MQSDIFSATKIEKLVSDSITNVFAMMLSRKIEFVRAVSMPNEDGVKPDMPVLGGQPVVSSSVGFTGTVNGIIYISMDENLAKHITCDFLGMEMDEVEAEGHEMVNDALGELANMSVGDFKNKLCDQGFNCMLTLPSILRGNNVSIESNFQNGVRRYVHQFDTEGETLIVDLLFKPEE